jgi:antitoxin component YwqK of YwqJK toxin-antitoxin module
MKWLFISFLFISFVSKAQWKSYRLTKNNDTINCIDKNDLRQGRWSIKIDGVRGEPGRDEEGVYKDGKKEGVWRTYTSMGDLYAIENYRWGNKDGKAQYFNITGIVREESWKAVNPANPYDTVDVYDPVDPNKMYRQVVKIEGSSVKHGTWNYYNDGLISKSENYFLDKLQSPFGGATASGKDAIDGDKKTQKAPVKTKPKEVMEFEKKVGKKKVKVIDGTTF